VNVVFQPASTGTRRASLNIADTAANSPQAVPLMGTATQPAVTLSPTTVNFGNQTVGTPSSAVSVAVTNSGNGPLVIGTNGGISFGGTNAGDFSETSNCTGSAGVAAGGTCTIQITFNPACGTAAAARSATLSLSDNAPGSPQAVALSGTGTGFFCFLFPSGSSSSASVSPGQTGSYSLEVEAANGFTGNVALGCSGAPSAATCTITPSTVNIGGSELAPMQVSVATSAGGSAAPYFRPEVLPGKRVQPDYMGAGFSALLVLCVLTAFVFVWRACENEVHSAGGLHAPLSCRRDVNRLAALTAIVLAVAIGLAACGGGGGSSNTPNDPATPAGTYTIVVTGTPGSGAAQSTMLTLTVE
jgi:trimeric autotransporter adhesin